MTLPDWPKTIKLADVVDALEELAEQVAFNNERINTILGERDTTIAQLQHDLDQHRSGAVERQAEIDRLRADVRRQAFAQRTGRRL